jgi:WhiB family redox-sensing transcriptional regulator
MTADQLDVAHPDWHAYAPCRGLTDLFFPGQGEDVSAARAVCATCPYTEPCLRENVGERYGIFGGMTAHQRQQIRMGRSPKSGTPGRPKQGHGTRACYLAGCKCEPCHDAHRVYDREYKRRRRMSWADGGTIAS